MQYLFLFIISIFIISSGWAKESAYTVYTIQQEDSVSEVMARYAFKDLYTKEQWVQKVLKMNHLTEATARQLKQGDIIVLPLKSTVLDEAELKEKYVSKAKLNIIKKTWKKEVRDNWKKPKVHNLTVIAGYAYDDYSYKTNQSDVRVNQIFNAALRYKKRKLKEGNRWNQNLNGEVGFYTQSNASFVIDKSKVAEFTPSVLAKIGWELEDRKYNWSFNPIVKNEFFSSLVFDGFNHDVKKINMMWSGAELTKTISKYKWSSFVTGSSLWGNQFNSKKLELKAGTQYKNRYLVEAYTRMTQIQINEKAEVASSGINIGYKF